MKDGVIRRGDTVLVMKDYTLDGSGAQHVGKQGKVIDILSYVDVCFNLEPGHVHQSVRGMSMPGCQYFCFEEGELEKVV